MKTYTMEELKEILRLHSLYLTGSDSGKRADLSFSNLRGSNLSNNNLRGSDLRGSNLSGSDLRGSDLRDSYLRDSDLRGSDLRGSDLRGSDLRGSDLRGSNLSGVIGFVYIGQRSDGHHFLASYASDQWRIKAGCRNKTIEEYREHALSYECAIKRQETLNLLDFAEKRIKLLGRTE